jgi:eukaryotic-like serine/threonine-protein kinase
MDQVQDQKIGTVLDGKYEITRLIGEGGMGVVYEATHKLIGRKLAIKFLHALYATNPEVVTRFQREAQAAAQIGHENIIEVTDMGCAPDGSPYLVMECLEGTDVKKIIERDGALSVKRTALILVQALSALEAAHDVGIIHRDLKPDNIFLIARGLNPDYVKLLDFGISKFRSFEDGVKGLTQTGTVLGTPHYMSPEQARGEQDLSHQSDIYAMGVIMYQMLSAALPYDAPNYNALLMKIVTEEPQPIRKLVPELPAQIVETVERAMARDTRARFATCAEMRERLLPFAPALTEIGTLVAPTSSHTVIRKALYEAKTPFELSQSAVGRTSRSKWAIAASAGGLVVAAAIGALVLARGPADAKPTAPMQTAAVLPVPTAAPVEASSSASAAPTSTVHLAISAAPKEARIYVDGELLGANPFEGDLARGAAAHVVEASADGYLPERRVVAFDADAAMAFELVKADGEQAKPEKGAKRGKKRHRKIDASDPW